MNTIIEDKKFMDPKNVSIIIPALNEEKAIDNVVRSIFEKLPDVEIFVVDDGSIDNTGKLAAKEGAKVLTHEYPYGYGASLRHGIEMSKKEYVLCCDGDGQHRAEDVVKLINEIDGYDMVVGKRDSNSHRPINRRPGKFVLHFFANYLSGSKIPDLNSGLRIFKKDVLLHYMHLMPSGFSFSTTSTFAFMKTNRRIKYVSISVKERIGKSTVSPIKHGFQAIMLMLRLTVLFEPLKVFLHVASGLFFLSIVSISYDFIAGIRNGFSDTSVLLLIAMLLIFLFGLLCDQVSSMRLELHDKSK